MFLKKVGLDSWSSGQPQVAFEIILLIKEKM